jgi:hypothetical protein
MAALNIENTIPRIPAFTLRDFRSIFTAQIIVDENRRLLQCAGINRHKQRMKEPYEKGVAIRSASSLALGIARYSGKRRQSRRGNELQRLLQINHLRWHGSRRSGF